MTNRAAKLLMLSLSIWGVLAPCALAKPFIAHPVIPVITSHGATASVEVDENNTAVATITFTPLGSVLSLSGADASLFSINQTENDASLRFTAAPDYETPGDTGTNNVYNFTLTCGTDRTDSTVFTVTVADVDEGTPGGDVTAPTIVSASTNVDGTQTTIGFSENVTNSSGLSLFATNGPASMVYVSGSGTDEYIYANSRPILDGETVTLAATSSNIVDGATNTLADFSGFAVTNNSTATADPSDSLRPAIFPAIPSEATSAGFAPNDLSTSVRTDVVGTTRAAVVEIAGGTYSAPITLSTANRTYRLMGNVTFDGCGLEIRASNITIDLNGYTLTYMNSDMEDWQVGTIVSSANGNGSSRPTVVVTGVSNSGTVLQFLDGPEAGNWYEYYSGTAPNLTLENANVSTDEGSTIASWQSGGPAPGNTFRIFEPRKTFGIGCGVANYNKNGVEIINGYIVQGSAAGRGYNRVYNQGCSPIYSAEGGSNWLIGGVKLTWSSGNTGGIITRYNDAMTVKRCEFDDQGTFLSNRQRPVAAVNVNANCLVQYNRITNHRHLGVELLGNGVTVERNEIYGDSRATNAGGILSFAKDNNAIRYNNVYKTGEHPICIAIHDGAQNNNVYGNWCEAKTTRASSEYPWNYACGLSNRWAYSGYRSIANNFYENAFITYSEDGPGPTEISRAKTLFFGALQYTPGENVYDNFIGAYSTDDETECHCIGLSIHNSNVVIRDNILAGSHNIFWIGDDYGHGTSGGRFIDNAITKVGSDAGFKTFMANGYFTGNADFISNTYGAGTGTASTDIGQDDLDFGAPDGGNIFRFGFNLTVTVTQGGNPVSGATVTIKDASNNTLRSGYTTNGSGVVVVDVPTFYRQGPLLGSTSLNALTVQAVSGASSGSNTISPTSDDTISVGITP